MEKQQDKVKDIDSLAELISKEKKAGKKVALVTGCFDVIHHGHLGLFDFVKEDADILVVGIDNDETIAASKGKDRPIFKQAVRTKMLSDLVQVDYVFIVEEKVVFDSDEADEVYAGVVKKIMPDFIATNKEADRYWGKKLKRAEELGVEFIAEESKKLTSTTEVAKLLESEL